MPDPRTMPPDDRLVRDLAALGDAIAWPSAPDLATRVSQRLASAPAPDAGQDVRRWGWLPARPARRALLAAAALLLALVAVAAAATLLLPGLRLVTLPAGSTLPPAPSVSSVSPPGLALGLGVPVDLTAAERLAGFRPVLPDDRALGPPDDVHVADGRVNLVWRARTDLPEIQASGIGLIVTEFRGRVDEGWYEKLMIEDVSRVERVTVAGSPAYWLTGAPHLLFYVDARGRPVEETRRVVGNVLMWRLGDLTMRIEGELGREATIALAERFVEG